MDEFDQLLAIFARHSLDALTVHARTVAQMYRLPVHYDRIRQAVETMPCPVIANGHVYSAAQAQELLAQTGARGLMIGRGVIRSPWLFNQIRQQLRGETVTAADRARGATNTFARCGTRRPAPTSPRRCSASA